MRRVFSRVGQMACCDYWFQAQQPSGTLVPSIQRARGGSWVCVAWRGGGIRKRSVRDDQYVHAAAMSCSVNFSTTRVKEVPAPIPSCPGISFCAVKMACPPRRGFRGVEDHRFWDEATETARCRALAVPQDSLIARQHWRSPHWTVFGHAARCICCHHTPCPYPLESEHIDGAKAEV